MWNGDGTHHFTDGNPLIFWLSQYLVIISQYLHKLTNELKQIETRGIPTLNLSTLQIHFI